MTLDMQPHYAEATRIIMAGLGQPPDEVRYAHWYNARHPNRKVSVRRLTRPMRQEAWLRFNPMVEAMAYLVCVIDEDAFLNGTSSRVPIGILR